MPSRPVALLSTLPVLLLAGPARASDFGCPAEWIDLGMVLAVPLGVVWALLLPRIRAAVHLGLALGAAGLATLAVLASSCTYGKDQDGWALLAVALSLVPSLLAQAWRRLRAGASADG